MENIFKNNQDKLEISSNEITRKKDFEFYDVSWQTYRAVSIALLTISAFLIYFVRIHKANHYCIKI